MMKKLLYLLIMLCSVCSIHAEFSLVHKTGAYSELQENGMQKTHTDYQIMYARPGETVYLYRPEKCTFVGYVRWYNYDTDRAIPSWYSVEDSPTGVAIPRIESTWKADTVVSTRKFKAKNEYGWFGYDLMTVSTTGKATDTGRNYAELKYTMHNGDSVYRIACDQGIWKDYSPSTWNDNVDITEPTLSKRIIFEIRPAKWIADSLENYYKVSPENPDNDDYLEEHELIAPTGRQLYIGPNYMYRGSGKQIKLKQYYYYSRSNYHYYNSQDNITLTSVDANWKWYKNGVEDPTITLQDNSAQFVPVSNPTPDTVIYTLKYNSSPGYYFNIARFKVIYMDVNEVGPSTSVSNPNKNMDLIYEQNFNYDRPNTTNFAFWNGYLGVDESTYGYYTKNISASNRQTEQNKITWSEYAITNKKAMWQNGSASDPQTYQHVDGTNNEVDNAKEGYMLYVDGSQQPGVVFNLKVNTDLCPGSTMYFYAWVCDASSTGTGNSAPNMDFEVTGIDEYNDEHALTTFTTGEFGINAVEKVGKSSKMNRGVWYQIMFPVKFTTETTYPAYRLRIMNKSTSSDGNDFAIDDIRIYVQKPAVNPIQASTYDCPSGTIDSVTSYLRVDYQAINDQENTFYYQWRDYNDSVIVMQYANGDNGDNSRYGSVVLPESEAAVIAAGDTCSSLLSFDTKYYNTKEPVVKYIKERIDPTTERYIMYIAQPMVVRTNYNYTGYVAVRPQDLGSESECGTKAELLIAGGTRITIDGEALGDSVISLCGNRSYTLDIVLTYITQNSETGELEEHTTPCKADWLIGDSAYVNENIEVYKYTFAEIENAVVDYRTDTRSTKSVEIVNYLLKHNLLVRDTSTTSMQPSVASSYTAFPISGSANNGMAVCLTPRFLYINSDIATTNMVVIGDSTETLPQAIADRPRVVRISNAQKNTGSFTFNTYIKGEDETYIVEKATLVSSTNTNWNELPLIELVATSTSTELSVIDSITIVGADLRQLEAGYDYTFHVEFKDEDQGCQRGYTYFTLRIVPDEVTWYGKEWNKDENWDTFVPLNETNVILQPKDYNVTFSVDTVYDINFQKNQCKNIYFPDEASMAGQQYININGIAFIDIKEYAWKWTLTSIPIQGVVTGDIFISVNESTKPFVVAKINQTVGSAANDRVTWQVYNKEYDAAKDKWKVATNTLVRPIITGEANMIGIDCETDDVNPIVRLPKQDNMYRYYEKNQHVWMNENEYIERDEETYGKPSWNGDKNITLKEIYTNIYLFGNPTFGYIDITKLVEDNSDKLTGRYYLEVEGATTIPKKDEMISFNHDVNTDEYHVLLPPYRGILLEGKDGSDNLTINIDSTKVNPTGRLAPKRYRNVDNDIPTNIENLNTNDITSIYDMMGHSYSGDLKNLQSGIYIIRSENKTYKIFLK